MRNVVYAALLVAIPAAAQPVTQPKACQVTIARAPDDVRAVVEAWVKSEVQCSVALEVRIVPTEGGLYLLAQDEQGRIRERIVPDAQTAGVLVASWIADDNAPLPPVPIAEPVAEAPAPMSSAEALTPPGLAPVSLTARAAAPARKSKWLALGGLLPFAPGSGFGLRIEADVWRRGAWMFGAAMSAANAEQTAYSSSGYGGISTEDFKVISYVARPILWGRWQLRPAIGVGLVHTEGNAYDGASMFYPLSGTFPTGEASIMLSRDLGKSWAAYSGPLATAFGHTFESYASGSPYPMLIQRADVDVVLMAGVRRRL